MELVVTVAIVSVLAAVAMPYAEVSVMRGKEMELRRDLREMRTAIDMFHADWEKGLIPPIADLASLDGYPRTLQILLGPVHLADGRERRYLRRIPREPFAKGETPAEESWRLIGYRDSAEAEAWGEEDIWDVASPIDAPALDGSRYPDW